jgi:hypothetical protein
VLAVAWFAGAAAVAPVAGQAAPPVAVQKPTAPAKPEVATKPAAAKPAKPAKPGTLPLPPVWIGVFDPKLPAHPPWSNVALTPVAHGGSVRVLAPVHGAAATGDVIAVHPLLGNVATGRVENGLVALAEFAFDQRDGDDSVLVLPAATPVAIVAPTKADVAAIRAVLARLDTLAGVRRALNGLELAGVDVDADGKADLVATYGCAAWFDGSCQSKGQFFLARHGARWAILAD